MTFDKIHNNLYAVREEGHEDNVLYELFEEWNDIGYLYSFFKENKERLHNYFHVRTIRQAVDDTPDDAEYLEYVLLYIEKEESLDDIFIALDKNKPDTYLFRSKARNWERRNHDSWLRIYALKLSDGIYVITGGAIKMVGKMQENEITLDQLQKLDRCRSYLKECGVCDYDGFCDLINNEN